MTCPYPQCYKNLIKFRFKHPRLGEPFEHKLVTTFLQQMEEHCEAQHPKQSLFNKPIRYKDGSVESDQRNNRRSRVNKPVEITTAQRVKQIRYKRLKAAAEERENQPSRRNLR